MALRKLLYVNPSASLGGAERCLLDLFATLRSEIPGVELFLITLCDGPLVEKARGLGVTTTYIEAPERLSRLGDSGVSNKSKLSTVLALAGMLPEALHLARQLSLAVREIQPDLIHSNGLKTHCLLALSNLDDIPIVWQLHDFLADRFITRRLLRIAARKIRAIVGVSQAVCADIRKTLPGVPSYAILNAVDAVEFAPNPVPTRATNESIRIGMVATYARWKGHLDFLEAARRLVSEIPSLPVNFLIVGGPVYLTSGSQISRDELQSAISGLGLDGRVELVPFQEEMAPIYRSLDVVVHASSRPEPFGKTIIEAMACGRAVIVSRGGGAGEIFTHGTDALGFSPGNIGELTAAMQTLVTQPETRGRMGARGRETILRRFSLTRYAREWASLYQRISERSSAATRPNLVVAMGFLEDNWHSSRTVATGLFETLVDNDDPVARDSVFHAPTCRRYPKWTDRRLRYARSLPEGRVLQLMDHSYGDALLHARHRFDHLVVLIHDLAFWKTRTPTNAFFRDRIRRGLKLADCRVACSTAMAREIERELGLEIHAVIPHGLNLDLFPHSREPRVPGRLLSVGNTDFRKGLDRLIRLLSKLPQKYELYRIGQRMTEEQVALADRLHVRHRIRELGELSSSEISAHYQAASVLLFPSRYEGFGLPIIEARLCGTRVVAHREVPSLEYVAGDIGTSHVNFSTFDREEDDGQGAILETLLQLDASAESFENREFFHWRRAAAQYQKLYESLLGSVKE